MRPCRSRRRRDQGVLRRGHARRSRRPLGAGPESPLARPVRQALLRSLYRCHAARLHRLRLLLCCRATCLSPLIVLVGRRSVSASTISINAVGLRDRKSTRLNSSHTVIYTLSLHDALPISITTLLSSNMFVSIDRVSW